ncbi:YkgJ family cysteine cluster protein [Shinella kummerowiae]|uniref:YkgJ family cysteine cluster protein n=1 Tax=Shinella kummerowiae TaxID=417745 RepID=UPI0021B66378|nr:YkgJ family cysteine cluster protein [Shinella kummerowiae]MCT7663340.1 YkgJ family cysteine cluster protein [Shinella kummerowiae]
MYPSPTIVPGRSCGTCTLCCRLPDIDLFEKPANAWCRHCIEGKGCSIYADRPSVCRDFLCLWMTDESLDEAWEPSRSHMMIYRQGPQITVLVDPDHPDIWRREPYHAQLRAWASKTEPKGGYVIVFWQDNVVKI